MSESELSQLKARNEFLEKFYRDNIQNSQKILERIKELTCMYNVAKCVVLKDDFKDLLSDIVNLLPAGWQFPDKTSACIKIWDDEYQSHNYVSSEIMLVEHIYYEKQIIGRVEVSYHGCVQGLQEPFLREEQELLFSISNILSLLVKQHLNERQNRIIQQQLLHADRLASIGELAAGVAHELNEPLTNILGFTQLSLKNEFLPSVVLKDLKRIEEASFYAKGIIQKLMEFSRQSSPKLELINLSDVIEKSLYFIEARCAKESIIVKKKLGEAIHIYADSDQIKQVLINLAINGMQAMKSGGLLTISTDKDENFAKLIVSDVGVGIPPENISKIFMPFFTTKDVGEGTGLGLSVLYGIVKNHNGDIKVSSELGKGSTFFISFPLENKK